MSIIRKVVVRVSPFHSLAKKRKSGNDKRLPFDLEKQQADEAEEKKWQEERNKRDKIEERNREAYEMDDLRERYGPTVGHQAPGKLDTIDAVSKMKEGDRVHLRARIHRSRPVGSKIIFIVLRQGMSTIQSLLSKEQNIVSENMVSWAKRLRQETLVLVEGVVQTPKDGQQEINNASVHDLEIKIHKLYVVTQPTEKLPFRVYDAARPSDAMEREDSRFPRVNDRTRLANRVLDLRNPSSQAIFRIHAGICRFFRSFLDHRGFTEIHSSKIQESGTESGASVFKLDYFQRPAFLAQSPQLAKQMCIAADMERVYEIGPVFRAEDSNTHRHLTEFIGLDIEMVLDYHYSEVIDILDEILLRIFRGLQSEFREEIEVVKQQYPHEDIVFPERTLRLTFKEGVKLLRESGWKEDDGSIPSDERGLSTKAEQRLGQIIKEKFNTDYYIMEKFPLGARPFYTMPDPENRELSNSYDFFLRGEEILSGGQRINDAQYLERRMKDAGIDPTTMKDYLDAFRWGCPPHGGGGIGLERLIMLFLNIHNVRWASLFPRDPRSFAKSAKDTAEVAASAAQSMILQGPTARTLKRNESGDHPRLGDLIARYGDATNTSWVDPAWTIWRHQATGAAVGYIPSEGFAIAFGNPLCEPDQRSKVIRAFLEHINEEQRLKPVWCCVDYQMEQLLTQELGWSAVIAAAEERLKPTEVTVERDKGVRRKIHRAERLGVKLHEIAGTPSGHFMRKLDQRLRDWEANRTGKQIHLTGLRPFDDEEHRRYYYATDKDGQICCLVVLSQLAPHRGFQFKWALEFPGAPSGAIEYILSDVIRKLGEAGVKSATFGCGAAERFQSVDNVSGPSIWVLEKMYNGLSHTFGLSGKGDFRSKFGVYQDPLYICYPQHGLGLSGIRALMDVLQSSK